MNVLYAWLGKTDLRAVDGAGKLGPVADTLLHLPVESLDRVVLLYDHAPGKTQEGEHYASWLNAQLASANRPAAVTLKCLPKTGPGQDPTNYNWVFDAMRRVLAEDSAGSPIGRRLYLIGGGTPTMVACTIIVSRMAACEGELWQADEHDVQRCRRLELPFGLRLDDAPDPQSGAAERWQKAREQRDDAPVVASPATQRAWRLAERAAASRWPVLITGSTGSGKEVLAQHIYASSGLAGPFRAINCGAIPENLIEAELFGYRKGAFTGATRDHPGIFEAAGGGMVFLDEVGELPLTAQVKFLRVLQEVKVTRLGEREERPIDCRILAATHRNLWRSVSDGRFREDLYYRLAGILIELPDLVARPEDLSIMIDRFWQEIVEANPGFPGRRLHDDARGRLMVHAWPGNVRELRATLARTAFLAEGPEIHSRDIDAALAGGAAAEEPPDAPAPEPLLGSLKEAVEDYKRRLVSQALAEAQGNQARAARTLGVSAQHLGRLLKR